MTIWKDQHAQWDSAGMVNPKGDFFRSLPLGALGVPTTIKLDGDRLLWSWLTEEGRSTQHRTVKPEAKMLEGFLRLGDAPPEQILRYAQRWGVIGVCEHGLPIGHNPGGYPSYLMQDPGCLPLVDDGWMWEPLEVWRRFARQARALLNIAAQVHRGHLGSKADWQAVDFHGARNNVGGVLLIVDHMLLKDAVNDWLTFANARLVFDWNSEQAPAIYLGHGLFGNLAVQLMSAVSRTEGLALCSACGTPYLPPRQPRAGERHYCQECRKMGAPQRDASRQYRQRRRTG